ncbi:Multidrug resistance protein MdtH [Dickeya dianthicola]|uniref:MFS transporter n=1 Tax=Dickeya dianthicola TaxID=204039 RepID=A0ABX9NT48_9GAMM|nr:MFS transporter [Dickeya dianthicola]AYC18342.1 Multidrug resistance protein MdtH [Dickeya dianthicola]MBI0439969.1 MFS transporter [Dickeya dianthicola]MBI0450707.1 MFS transporter [Dickeya dianthicola]MBI0455282.1 MFS transporter [Dickeya dianthicola]MBI0459536.1 MFS transporter [Dickeya dianthicola]
MKDRATLCSADLTMRQTLATFPRNVSILLFFTLLTRLSYFMAWPFLSIILTRTYQLTPLAIGSLMSGCALISVILGIYGGSLSDRLGRKTLLVLGCLLAIVGYAGIALANGVFVFAFGLLLTGISFSWIDAPSRAFMSDLLQDQKRRELALQIRYFAVNIAAVSGPLIGITFGLNSQKSTFLLTAFSYIPFLLFSLWCIPPGKPLHHDSAKESHDEGMPAWQVVRLIFRDNIYIIILISSILCYLVYAQIESIVPQYLLMLDTVRAVDVVTAILVTNAVTVLVAQFYLVPLFANTPLEQRIMIGALIFALSQMLFWANDTTSTLWWGGCAMVFSIAEAILLPNLSILLDRLAPERYRGAYLGASTLVVLGLSLGPFVGGALLEWSGKGVFVMMALFCLSIAALMLINKKKIKHRLEE